MALRNSNIIIAKGIKTDRDYINVVNINEVAMLGVMRSSGYFVAESSTYSFIRDTGSIQVNFTYAQCLQSNYVAFQNPDYSNKWIFGWIDQVLYVDDGNTQIYYTVDYWTTWWTYFNFQPVLVEREHVNDDSFGLHLLPEPVPADLTEPTTISTELFSEYYLMIYSLIPSGSSISTLNNKYFKTSFDIAYSFDSASLSQAVADLQTHTNNGDLIALGLFPVSASGVTWDSNLNKGSVESISTNPKSIPAPVNLNGYVPINKKLLTYPYNYLTVDDGTHKIALRYENFGDINNIQFAIRGFANPVGEVECVPRSYEGYSANIYYALSIKDFPMLPSIVDSYQAWLAQKSNANILSSITGLASGAAMGAMAGGAPGAIIGGVVGAVGSYLTAEQAAKDAADSVRGGNSSSILDCAMGDKGFYFKQISLKADMAKVVDNFFSKYGYSQNIVKTPNLTGRTYWNYVKVNGVAGYGNMPEDARNRIIKMLNDGVTIWHDHTYLGNYFIGGSKMENPIV